MTVIERPDRETPVGSSTQFLLRDWSADDVLAVVSRCTERGVELKWFGAADLRRFLIAVANTYFHIQVES